MSSTLPSFYIVDSMISVQADEELGYDNAIDDAIELPNGTVFPMLGESLKRSNETTGDVDEGHTKRAAAGQIYDLKTGHHSSFNKNGSPFKSQQKRVTTQVSTKNGSPLKSQQKPDWTLKLECPLGGSPLKFQQKRVTTQVSTKTGHHSSLNKKRVTTQVSTKTGHHKSQSKRVTIQVSTKTGHHSSLNKNGSPLKFQQKLDSMTFVAVQTFSLRFVFLITIYVCIQSNYIRRRVRNAVGGFRYTQKQAE